MGSAVVAFVDVGQGDCTVAIDQSSGGGILIDCPPAGAEAALRSLLGHGVVRMELAVLTHGDLDHAGGMVSVLDALPPTDLRYNHDSIVSVDPDEKPKLKAVLRGFLGLRNRHGVKLERAVAGDSGTVGAIDWTVLSPTHDLITDAQVSGSRNRASVVLRLEIDGWRVLIAGDADGHAWRKLLNSAVDVSADVFLIPHHGAHMPAAADRPDITSVLAAVGAKHHVISCGTVNGYGHPAASTLDQVRLSGGRITCTEVNGHCLGQRALPLAEAANALPDESRLGGPTTTGSCPCAGSITFTGTNGSWSVSPSVAEHSKVISALVSPRCLPVVAP